MAMTDEMDSKDLVERVRLIESMMAEGRRRTASVGWSFVLWGVAYYVATAWATLGKSHLAWPVTMIAAGALTGIGFSRMSRGKPETSLSRAISGVWWAMGISISILLFSLGFTGRYDGHVFVAIIGAMLGGSKMASAFILKWKAQHLCAAVWLSSTVVACFGTDDATTIAFLAAVFLCQIVFGIYAMILESRSRKQNGVAHA
jgi:hypothetical protein